GYFKVPGGFKKRDHYILRLLPCAELLQVHPKTSDTDTSPFFFEITLTDAQGVSIGSHTIENMGLETLYVGAPTNIIDAAIGQENRDDRIALIMNHLSNIGWPSTPDVATASSLRRTKSDILASDSGTRSEPTEWLQPDYHVHVKVIKKTVNGQRPTCEADFTISQNAGIQNGSLK
ncbi:MAG: hypothetical protein GY809_04220, partial [Planctomycetes bacterium]|nr:hypothetical protein [Planctomycetota bacterium]